MSDVTSTPITRLERSVQVFFLFSLFSVPFSTALTNLSVGLTLLGFVLALATTPDLRRVLGSPPGLLALALLALFVIGVSWSIAPADDVVTALKKYAKLLILPIGIALSRRDSSMPGRALRWFGAGALMLGASCYLVWLDLMPTSQLGWWRVGDASNAFAFKNHITIGILLGFATLLSLLHASYARTIGMRLMGIAGGVFFAVPIIFLTQGRTGYLALFVGLVTLLLLRTRAKPLRTVIGVLSIVLMFVGFYAASDNFQSRTNDLVSEVRSEDPNSPNGLRLSFFEVGFEIIAAHPLRGLGTGAFSEAYAPTALKNWPAWSEVSTSRHQPHSEFLNVAVQLGVLGLALYCAMLVTLGRAALAVRSFETDSLALLWTIYVVSSTFNSLLWDPTEGYWFLMLGGCLYAAGMRFQSRSAA
jgi:O-antigen ligase